MIFEYGGVREATSDFDGLSAFASVANCRAQVLAF